MKPICVAFKAHLGWVNAVGVRAEADEPSPVFAERVELLGTANREILEPYHVAGGWHGLEKGLRPDNPAEIIRRGREQQADSALDRLAMFRGTIEQRFRWQSAVMLTSRGRLGDMEHMLRSHAQIHVAEGESIRDATRAALDELGIPCTNLDEKSILGEAAIQLGVEDCDAFMKERRPKETGSWRKEERVIALGAWLGRN